MPLGFQDARSRRYLGPARLGGLIAEKTAYRALQSVFLGSENSEAAFYGGAENSESGASVTRWRAGAMENQPRPSGRAAYIRYITRRCGRFSF